MTTFIDNIDELKSIIENAKRRNIKLKYEIDSDYELDIFSTESNDDNTCKVDVTWVGGTVDFTKKVLENIFGLTDN